MKKGKEKNLQALFSTRTWRKQYSRPVAPTEAKHSRQKYLSVNKVLLPVEQQLLICYLVISRGFVGVYKAIPRPHIQDLKFTNIFYNATLKAAALKQNSDLALGFVFSPFSSSSVTIISFP